METKSSAQNAMREIISADSPRRGGDHKHYFQGWTVKSVKTVLSANISDIEAIVYNKDKPSLTHLLEFSHPAGADRHIVKASPHIENNAGKYEDIYIKRIIETLKRGV